jgi:ABC-type cobalt transport system, permease component CbiQ and related transporters
MLSAETLILAFIISTIGIILTKSLVLLALYLVLTLCYLRMLKADKKKAFYAVKRLIPLLIVIFLMNGCFSSSEDPFFSFWIFTLTEKGFHIGAVIVFRTLLIMLVSHPITALSSPLAIASAMEHLLYPLKYLRFPVSSLSLIFSLIFSFVSTLMEETERIKTAQRLRGLNLEGRGVRKQMLALRSLSVPLFLSAFSKADELSFALESRGYDPNKKAEKPERFLFAADRLFILVVSLLNILMVLGGHYVAN